MQSTNGNQTRVRCIQGSGRAFCWPGSGFQMKRAPLFVLWLVVANGADAAAWVKFVSPEGRFCVEMPANPTTSKDSASGAFGKFERLRHVAEAGGCIYSAQKLIGVEPVPTRSRAAILDRQR